MSGLDFATMLHAEADDQILISTLHRELYNPKFKGIQVPVEAWTPRPYDGWFHPSTHSLWTIRQLYLYLTRPTQLQEEHMPLTGVLAVTAGKFWHAFLQMILLEDGILVQDEVPIKHEPTNRIGHADGVLKNGQCLEIKTINDYQVDKIVNAAILREKKPQYWAQTQDYLDCLNLTEMRYLIIAPTYPFRMSEFVVRADSDHQAKRRFEYRRAVELAMSHPDGSLADDLDTEELPRCCAPKSAEANKCPARDACPVGRYR